MEEIAKVLVGTSPVLAVVLLLGMSILTTIKGVAEAWHQDHVDAAEARKEIKHAIDEVTRRVILLETARFGEASPAQPRKPDGLDISPN